MKARIVKIGNSRGIRIPKPLLEQTGLAGEVDVSVDHDAIVIRPIPRAREGWAEAFPEMARQGDDIPLDPAPALSRWDEDEWEW